MGDFLLLMGQAPVVLQFIFWGSCLGVAAALPVAWVKSLNNWPVFFAIWMPLMVLLGPSLIKY